MFKLTHVVIRRKSEYRRLATYTVAALIFVVLLISQGELIANIGFLVLGAIIAFLSVFASDELKRNIQVTDLARALYEELANRVARCCFDFENPWKKWIDEKNCRGDEVSVIRLRKFTPVTPVIYPATASQIALLGNDAPQAIIRFYVALAVYQKDMEDVANFCQQQGYLNVPPNLVALLAERLRRTLRPGRDALRELSKMVEGPDEIEAAAIRDADEMFKHERSGEPLRKRLEHLIKEYPNRFSNEESLVNAQEKIATHDTKA